jgi:hypothetical protein
MYEQKGKKQNVKLQHKKQGDDHEHGRKSSDSKSVGATTGAHLAEAE